MTSNEHPVRPPKSPARPHHHTDDGQDADSSAADHQSKATTTTTMQSAVQNVSNVANQAYSRAPDLGFTQAAQNAYNRAPDFGIQSTVSRMTSGGESDAGGAAPKINGRTSSSQQQQQPDLQRPPKSGQRGKSNDRAIDFHAQQEDLRQISRERGPSSKDRIGKSQGQIGTEYGIPTRAGAGTTVSPDAKAKEAHKSKKSKPRQANVPEDYLPEPCPDRNAGTGKVDDVQQRYARRNGEKSPPSSRPNGNATAPSKSSDRRETSNATDQSRSSSTSEKRRSMGVRLRDQFRGELKILKGSLTNNHDTISRGISIKNGEAA